MGHLRHLRLAPELQIQLLYGVPRVIQERREALINHTLLNVLHGEFMARNGLNHRVVHADLVAHFKTLVSNFEVRGIRDQEGMNGPGESSSSAPNHGDTIGGLQTQPQLTEGVSHETRGNMRDFESEEEYQRAFQDVRSSWDGYRAVHAPGAPPSTPDHGNTTGGLQAQSQLTEGVRNHESEDESEDESEEEEDESVEEEDDDEFDEDERAYRAVIAHLSAHRDALGIPRPRYSLDQEDTNGPNQPSAPDDDDRIDVNEGDEDTAD
jgi:hypothetical protein